MKLTRVAVAVFGASAVLFGVIALLWHDTDTWQALRLIWEAPAGRAIGTLWMLLEIAGGLAIFVPAWRHFGAIALVAVFALGCVVTAIATVRSPLDYDAFFEQLSFLCGALALAGVPLVRVGFGVSVISFTITQAIHLPATARLVPAWLPPGQMFWSVLTTVAFGLAAIAILSNLRAVLALRLTACMTAIFGLLVWVRILIQAPYAHLAWSEFTITMLVTGAALCISETSAHGRERDAVAAH